MEQLKMKDWITILATIAVPVMVLVIGSWVSNAIQTSQNRVKYTEIAVGILNKPPSSERRAIREWAIQVLARYSPVPIDAKMKEELRKYPITATLNKTFDDATLESKGTVRNSN